MTRKPGRPKLENKKVSVTVHLDPEVAKELKRKAGVYYRSVSQTAERALRRDFGMDER